MANFLEYTEGEMMVRQSSKQFIGVTRSGRIIYDTPKGMIFKGFRVWRVK